MPVEQALGLILDDIAANEDPLNLGTLNSHPVILAHDDDYGEQVELYAYVDLDTTLLRQRVGNVGDNYIIFFIEKGEGEYANGGVVFTFESEINLADGSASTLTDIAPLEGASTETEINQAQNFVDFVAEKSNEYATTVEAYNKETESSIVTKLEDIGYVFQTYDHESYDYFQNKLKTDYDISVNVEKLYQGYVNQVDGFTQIIVLKNSDQATLVYHAKLNDANESGYHFRANNIVVYTVSITAYNALA